MGCRGRRRAARDLGLPALVQRPTTGNPNGPVDGATGNFSCWEVAPDPALAAAARGVAPFILAWIIVREHELSWPRGQMTAVVAIAALGLILYKGVIDRPGDPTAAISLELRAGSSRSSAGC